jgi:hypothetical protein
MLITATLTASLFFSIQAAPVETTATPAETEAANDDNKRVCRRVALIGTRMKKKVCATRKEWRDMAEQSRKTTGDIQRNGQSPGSGIGG